MDAWNNNCGYEGVFTTKKTSILVNKSNNTDFNCEIVIRIMIIKMTEILLMTMFVTVDKLL